MPLIDNAARPGIRSNDEDALLALVNQEIRESVGWVGGELTEQRRRAMQYYYGQPFGDEIEGRSQVVMTVVRDTVEWLLPELIEIFSASERIVVFEPTGEEDVELADQVTEYVNYVFYKDNNGFTILNSWFKDALLQKTGIVKAYYENTQSVQEEEYEGLTFPQLSQLQNDGDVEILQFTESGGLDEQGQPIDEYAVKVRRTNRKGRVKIVNVPPEEFLIARRSIDLASAPFVGHRILKTESDLILEGYDRDVVERLASFDELAYNEERIARHSTDDEFPYGGTGMEAMLNRAGREIEIVEAYIKVDFDGDGIAELRRVVIGSRDVILENEIWEHDLPPFHTLTPVPIPHKFFGLSIADLTEDLQRIQSVLVRGQLDAQYIGNNPRWLFNKDAEVDLDELLVARPGGVIGQEGEAPQVWPLETSPTGADSFKMVEYMEGVKEQRTGITRYNQGLDSNSLNKTASGINQIMGAAQQRKKLIARIFAETGVSSLFRHIHELVRKHQDIDRTIRLRGKWVPVDPREWKDRYDTTVHVGIGTGNRDMQLQHIQGLLQAQREVVQFQGGADGPLVDQKNIFNLLAQQVELAGWKTPEMFFSDPDNAEPKPPPPPDPAMEKIKAEMEIKKMELQFKQQEAQQRAQFEQQKTENDMRMRQMEFQADSALAQQEAQSRVQLAREEAQAKLMLAKEEAEIKLAIEAQRMGMEAQKLDADIALQRSKLELKNSE